MCDDKKMMYNSFHHIILGTSLLLSSSTAGHTVARVIDVETPGQTAHDKIFDVNIRQWVILWRRCLASLLWAFLYPWHFLTLVSWCRVCWMQSCDLWVNSHCPPAGLLTVPVSSHLFIGITWQMMMMDVIESYLSMLSGPKLLVRCQSLIHCPCLVLVEYQLGCRLWPEAFH